MAKLKFKTLYVNGDSWSAGDIVDPEIFGDQLQHSMHPDNKEYRLSRVWPHKLGKKLKVEVINNSHAGASNDRIYRSTINDILKLLKTTKPQDLHVVIGWSSPERKDFFYKEIQGHGGTWDCMYPAELNHWKDENNNDRDLFYRQYVKLYWNEEEYITRYCLQTIGLHFFLTNLGIKHTFFNGFYEAREGVENPDKHQLYDQPKLADFVTKFRENSTEFYINTLNLDGIIEQYEDIYNSNFIQKSFVEHLLDESWYYEDMDEILDFHPTELGHDIWAEYLYSYFDK